MDNSLNVLDAIEKRTSTRAFLDREVSKETIEAIMNIARWAPSGTNTQPWHVAVLQGQVKQQLSAEIITARHAGIPENPDYHYYTGELTEPYKTRRKECGIALYQALDIKRDDYVRRQEVWENNYRFFDSPVGLIFYIDRQLEKGSWLDMGMFIQNVMLAALGFGLATCPQAALAEYPDLVRKHLDLTPEWSIVCGMSLGYPDQLAAVNNYRTSRIPINEFVRFLS